MKQDLNQVITFLKMIATSTNGEIWSNDYADKPVYQYCLEKELISEQIQYADDYETAYDEKYAIVDNKGFDLIDLAS